MQATSLAITRRVVDSVLFIYTATRMCKKLSSTSFCSATVHPRKNVGLAMFTTPFVSLPFYLFALRITDSTCLILSVNRMCIRLAGVFFKNSNDELACCASCVALDLALRCPLITFAFEYVKCIVSAIFYIRLCFDKTAPPHCGSLFLRRPKNGPRYAPSLALSFK